VANETAHQDIKAEEAD